MGSHLYQICVSIAGSKKSTVTCSFPTSLDPGFLILFFCIIRSHKNLEDTIRIFGALIVSDDNKHAQIIATKIPYSIFSGFKGS